MVKQPWCMAGLCFTTQLYFCLAILWVSRGGIPAASRGKKKKKKEGMTQTTTTTSTASGIYSCFVLPLSLYIHLFLIFPILPMFPPTSLFSPSFADYRLSHPLSWITWTTPYLILSNMPSLSPLLHTESRTLAIKVSKNTIK